MNLLTENWHTHLPPTVCSVLLALVAVACGSVVGAERERKQKATGTRTLTLVSLGSCVFTMVSIQIGAGRGDPGHIAAQIVSGVGFLGAGAIMHGRSGVTGLTSAATLWMVAANGMAVGAGYAGAGLALSLLILTVLTIVSALENRYIGPCRYGFVRVAYDPLGGKTAVKIEQLLDESAVPDENRIHHEISESGLDKIVVRYCYKHLHHRDFLGRLAEMDEVREMDCTERGSEASPRPLTPGL